MIAAGGECFCDTVSLDFAKWPKSGREQLMSEANLAFLIIGSTESWLLGLGIRGIKHLRYLLLLLSASLAAWKNHLVFII